MADRLAFFLPSLRGGGAERVLLSLAGGFAERGVDVDLVLAKAEGAYIPHVPGNVRVVDLGQRHVLRSLPGLVAYLKRGHPAALLSGMGHANLIAIWAKRLARVNTRVVASVHSTASRIEGGPIIKRHIVHALLKSAYHHADGIVAVSKGVADDYSNVMQLPRQAVRVIYNPAVTPGIFRQADANPTHPWYAEKTSPLVLSAGRLTIAKDYPTLIRAMAMVHAQAGARLIILGEGEARGRLTGQIHREGLDGIVDMPGFADNPFSYMKHSDVFVLSSAWEGFGMALVEAMAMGTPVVSTDCPNGPAEILEGGKWGRLVPVGDAHALAAAIVETLQHPQRNAALKRANDFSLDKIIHEYAHVLRISI
jgi:glycosyltransferase involved in cell wall biosynthesis